MHKDMQLVGQPLNTIKQLAWRLINGTLLQQSQWRRVHQTAGVSSRRSNSSSRNSSSRNSSSSLQGCRSQQPSWLLAVQAPTADMPALHCRVGL